MHGVCESNLHDVQVAHLDNWSDIRISRCGLRRPSATLLQGQTNTAHHSKLRPPPEGTHCNIMATEAEAANLNLVAFHSHSTATRCKRVKHFAPSPEPQTGSPQVALDAVFHPGGASRPTPDWFWSLPSSQTKKNPPCHEFLSWKITKSQFFSACDSAAMAAQPIPHTLHLTPHTPHPTPHTPHPTPHTSHPTPHTPHPTPHTLHPEPHTPHPTPH